MSTKLIRSSTDEKADMQKQLGCMNGIFQLFGRTTSHNHKRLPAGTCRSDDLGTEPNSTNEKSLMQRNILPQLRKEKKLIPCVELSRTSCSSSCSSSTFSSADCNKTSQSEQSSSCYNNFPEMTSLVPPPKPPSATLQLSRQPLDIHDIVKQSMYKPAPGLSIKTKTKDVKACETIKQQDSPRPQQQDKHVQSKINRRDTSLGVMAKLQDGHWNAKDEKNGALPLARRDAPRYSYDETESRHTLKSTTKLKEHPRLSLDSRERSAKKSSSEYRRIQLSKKDTDNKITEILIESQEPGSNKKPSALVARLMGFEPIADSTPRKGQGAEVKSSPDEASETISPSLKVYVGNKQSKGSDFPKVHCKNSISPRYKNDSLFMDSTPGSMFLLGREPWAQTESFQGSQRQSTDYKETPTKPSLESVSVYSEIRKKLGELEFRKAGKDLRAPEHIIEAIEKKRERLGNNKHEDQISYSEDCTSQSSLNTSFSQASTQQRKCKSPVSPNKGLYSSKRSGTQVVNRQPTNVLDNSSIPTDGKSGLPRRWSSEKPEQTKNIVERRTTRKIISRNNGRRVSSSWPLPYTEEKKISNPVKSLQHLTASQQMHRESPANFRKSTHNLSSRLQQKYHGREKLLSFTTQSSDMTMFRMQSSKPPVVSTSSTRRLRPKSANTHRDDRTNRSTTHPKNIYHRDPTQSENTVQLAEQIDEEREVETVGCVREISTINELKDPNKEDYKATLEQPSPVSVLDITFYEEDIPSPVKKISTAFQDTDNLNSEESEGSAGYIDFLQNSRSTESSFEFDQLKVDDVGHAVHKLGLLNTSQDKATTDNNELLTNPDHTYIAEILRSTGLLSEISSPTTIQINPKGLTVNPDLFRVLEKDVLAVEHQKTSTGSIPRERVQRKLVFDAVSEILSKGSVDSSTVQNKMEKRTTTGEKLLKELCTKLDHQQATPNNNSHEHESWTGYSSQLPGLVLDIERMIFKDLISEIANGEAFPQQNRQLVST